jgi:RNA polymerase sigma factor (sigma-70 family)
MITGNDQWVVEIITEQGPALERSVLALVHDTDEAADICQEVALRLLIAARSGMTPEVPGAWIWRVARNLAISGARRKSTATRAADRLVDRREPPTVDSEVLAREQRAQIRATLAAARDVDRDAILLAADGLRTREIAGQLGRSELATRALLCRARARVRRELERSDAL